MGHYKISDVVMEINERENTPANSKYERFVGLEHYISGDVIIRNYGSTELLESSMKVFHSGDILIARRNVYLKRASMVDFDGLTSGDSIVLRAKDPVIGRILPFVLNTDAFWDFADQYSDGTMSKRLSPKTLMTYEFDLPDEDLEQFADVLWAANDTKEAYQELLRQTDELVKSQFIEMFGDPILNDKEWKYAKFPEVTTIVLGSTPRTNKDEYWDGDIKWISPAEITDDAFYIYDTVKHITELGVKSAGLKPFPAGTVLFSTRAPIGKTAIAGCEMYCNQGFKNFICGPELRPVYLYYLLRLKRDYFEDLGSGTTFKELSRGAIEKIAISVPDLELQEQFETLFKQSDKSKYYIHMGKKRINKEKNRCLMKMILNN